MAAKWLSNYSKFYVSGEVVNEKLQISVSKFPKMIVLSYEYFHSPSLTPIIRFPVFSVFRMAVKHAETSLLRSFIGHFKSLTGQIILDVDCCCWILFAGHCLLATGCWPLVARFTRNNRLPGCKSFQGSN